MIDYDVFIGHSYANLKTVRALAKRLELDGVRVWFNEWGLQFDAPLAPEIALRLERSRLVLCFFSADFISGEWQAIEQCLTTLKTEGDLSKPVIALRLDESEPPGSFEFQRTIDWRGAPTDDAFAQLADCVHTDVVSKAARTPETGVHNYPSGHWGLIYGVSVDWESRRLLTCGEDDTIRVWDLSSGRCLSCLKVKDSEVTGVRFLPQRNQALSWGWDGVVRLWDLASGQCLLQLRGHRNAVNAARLSTDGQQVISCGDDKTVRLWSLQRACCLRVLEGHSSGVQDAAFSPDGQQALSGDARGALFHWNLADGSKVGELDGHSGSISSIQFRPDGKLVFSGATDCSIRTWQWPDGHATRVSHHKGAIDALTMNSEGTHIYAQGEDGSISAWQTNRGHKAFEVDGPGLEDGHCIVAADGKQALHCSSGGVIDLQDLPDGIYKFVMRCSVGVRARISPDGDRVLSYDGVDTLLVWVVKESRCIGALEGHSGALRAFAFRNGSNEAVSIGQDGTIRYWDLSELRCRETVRLGEPGIVADAISFSENGTTASVCYRDGGVRNWDLHTGTLTRELEPEGGEFRATDAVLDESGRRALTYCNTSFYGVTIKVTRKSRLLERGIVRLWNIGTGQCIARLKGHRGEVCAVAFSPDGERVLTCDMEHEVRLWELKGGSCLRVFNDDGIQAYISAVQFAPDGKSALVYGFSPSLRIYDLETGTRTHLFEVGGRRVVSAIISEDGCEAIAIDSSGVMYSWRLH